MTWKSESLAMPFLPPPTNTASNAKIVRRHHMLPFCTNHSIFLFLHLVTARLPVRTATRFVFLYPLQLQYTVLRPVRLRSK